MANIFIRYVIRPRCVGIVRPKWRAHRVQSAHELSVLAQNLEYPGSDPGHDMHVGHHVRRVGDLDANVRNRRADRTHTVRNHVHRAAGHGPGVEPLQLLFHLGRIFPIVGWAGLVFGLRADESSVFDPGHVRRIGPDQNAVRTLLLRETNGCAGQHHQSQHALVFLRGAVTPVNSIRFAELRRFFHPLCQTFVFLLSFGFYFQGKARHKNVSSHNRLRVQPPRDQGVLRGQTRQTGKLSSVRGAGARPSIVPHLERLSKWTLPSPGLTVRLGRKQLPHSFSRPPRKVRSVWHHIDL